MRTYNHLFENTAILQSFLSNIHVNDSESVLIRIHSAIHSKDEMAKVTLCIKEVMPTANIVGCSSVQIINEGRLIPQSCLVSISVFENANIISGSLHCVKSDGTWRSGTDLAGELLSTYIKAGNGFLLIFFPLGYSKIEEFVDKVNKADVSVKMLGGAAYNEDEKGNSAEKLAYVINDSSVSIMDASFAYITSESLYVYGDYACGVEAVGKKNHIKCDGSYIDEVDGVDAAEWYAQMLGPDDLKKDASLSHIFPLVKRDEKGVAYYVDYLQWSIANNGEILYRLKAVSELKNGSSMSLGYFNPQNIFGQVKDLLHNVSENPAETIFAYDCHARNMILHNCAGWEIGNFNKTNISGALLSGEILSRNNENMYANYTFVLTALSEHEDSHFVLEPPDAASIRELQEDNVQMLNYLLVNANRRLNNEFQSQQDKMRDAVFYNASVGLDNQLKYRYDKERKGLDKTAIFSLNNEKMLRLFAGSTETYKLLKNCYSKVKKRFRVEGMYMYSYNDISLFIAANDKVSENKFSELVDEIHLFLNNSMYDEIQLSYTTVILFGQEDSMNRLEAALRYAINHKLSMIRFDEIGDDLKKEQEDVRLLWVVREALLHRRVTPYFQEIHDNTGGGKRMYESLMRVTDAEGKIYYPDEFLPVAKEYDLYESLSEMMVGEVIDMFRNKDVRVTINLNVQDIYNRNMLRMIFKNMQEVEHPENFVFEIVESEEIKDYEYIKGFADRIHEYGGRIAIDDFGSGFSNILHVLKIGADYIKVDGAVVRTISEEPRCRDFIEFMNDWCDKMGQKLICEYVENKEIQNIMEEIGVAFSQGYYFSKPHRWTEEDAV